MSMTPAPRQRQGTGQGQGARGTRRETRSRQDLGSTSGGRQIMGLILGCTIMSLVVVKVASAATLYQQPHLLQQQQQTQSVNDIESSAEENQATKESEQWNQSESDSDIEKMRAKLQQLQHEQQQLYLRQQQQQLQLHLQQMQAAQGAGAIGGGGGGAAAAGAGAGAGGETAYLLERADNQLAPIYGTWRTKARRQPHATASHELDDAHVYERLPRRSATMTPLKGLLRDQMPRPPRLSTQEMSQLSLGSPSPPPTTALLRRQYSETPGTRALRGQAQAQAQTQNTQEEFKPKPFHFPYDGPLPEQFTKGEAVRPELNNIQDILQHLHIGGGLGPSKLPPMVMMPTGLHIAGTFKNLKSSGIGNFFRGKRHKKQMQFTIPMGHMPLMPMAMPMPMSMQWYAPPSHQRVAIEQLYPYKPRSPQDVNLLAMQPVVGNGKPLSKNKKKKQQQQLQQQLLEHGSQQHFVADPFLQHFALNATRQPQHKRVPFKVNLDIYPVLPPSRPSSVLRHPFQQDYALPSAAALTGTTAAAFQMGHGQHPGLYQQTSFKFPTQQSAPVVFPDQATRFSQQQALYQHKFPPPPPPEDAIYGQGQGQGHGPVESQTNPIMLHLNVFPKQKPTATIRASTNPFYNHNMQRNTVNSNELPPPNPPSPIEPRQAVGGNVSHSQQPQQQPQSHQPSVNQTQQQNQLPVTTNRPNSISRSDHVPLIDFEHPIVAAELPDRASLTGYRQDHHQRYRKTPVDEHFRYGKSANIEQLAAEAQTASLFRFPVEDLIQFQVDDAL
ncbi:uncharacterized protein LOC110190080 [Drosophila serrata]|uniref:uncharacterized protein LOC110190080 n=1 Tax=Drosophila serrata TaxID=7274 RepID=UPI000A1D145C|nr:uncharacterized protein LOC110190080 [Drosophila serrata]